MDTQIVYLPAEGFIRLKLVLTVFPVSKSHWWAGVKSGEYPQPVHLGKGITAWRASDIRALIDSFSDLGKSLPED